MVDSSEGNPVELERAGNEEQSTGELLQTHCSLATESAGQDDDNSARRKGRTETGSTSNLSALLGPRCVLTRIKLGGLVDRDKSFASVLGATDLREQEMLVSIAKMRNGDGDPVTLTVFVAVKSVSAGLELGIGL